MHRFGICQRQQGNASFFGIEFRKLLQEMPGPPNSSGLRDNYSRGNVADFLRAKIREGSLLSVVSAYFTIYAYDALKTSLDRIDHLDFLFGEPSFLGRLDPNRTQAKSFIINADGLELTNKLQQKRVARQCAEWIQSKVDIKTIKQSNLLHGKMYRVANAGVEDAILGSSNFTVRGLGLGNGDSNIELNLIVDSNRDRQELKQWFDELWDNPALVEDVKEDVLQYLAQLYEDNAPEFIYYKTLFHIFEKFLGDAGKTDAELGQTSLFETGIWRALFEFQKDGAKGAINKTLRHNGCILADPKRSNENTAEMEFHNHYMRTAHGKHRTASGDMSLAARCATISARIGSESSPQTPSK